jgi:hypothetical protein
MKQINKPPKPWQERLKALKTQANKKATEQILLTMKKLNK